MMLSHRAIGLFNDVISKKLGFTLRPYQVYVSSEIIDMIEKDNRFIVVTMPTGSGKTLIEMFVAFYALKAGYYSVLVLEPTRFLCDQMYRLWEKAFGDIVGKEYEGRCQSFMEPNKRIIISTPITALKCVSILKKKFRVVIVDEVHHAFGGKYYHELLLELRPDLVIGFTALLPTYRRYRLDPKVMSVAGRPKILFYDFKRLTEIDKSFEPPKAIADLFDAEMNDVENGIYDLLFRGAVNGDTKTIKFLEITLARYGKSAFCESLERAIERGKILDAKSLNNLCMLEEPSHKARTLIDIFNAYAVGRDSELLPVIIFTSRKATAYEFSETIVRSGEFPGSRVEVLTSDMSRDERQRLVKRARRGEVDIIISTLVGEEGVDIPEAGLLIMSDTPKSPLRFYQRLGRLIRLASPKRIKYLVVSLTPKTREYWDLEEALWNLYSQGVDVSYIVINVATRGPEKRILDILDNFSKIYDDVAIPYALITQGRELRDPMSYLIDIIRRDERLQNIIAEEYNVYSDEALRDVIFNMLTVSPVRGFYSIGSHIKKALKRAELMMDRSSFSRVLDRAIEEGYVFYIYDAEKVSDVIARELRALYEFCREKGKRVCQNRFFRLDSKFILRLFMNIFPFEYIRYIRDKLKKRLKFLKDSLSTIESKEELSIYVEHSYYNERGKSFFPKINIYLKVGDIWINLLAQINYYNIGKRIAIERQSEIRELIELNLYMIGYKATAKFLEWLYE